MSLAEDIETGELLRPLIEAGELDVFLSPEQRWLWDAFWYLPPWVFRIVLHWARRVGKTYAVVVCFLALLIRYKGRSCYYLHPTQKIGKRLVHRAFVQITQLWPEDLKPEWRSSEGCILLPEKLGGGVLHVSGLETETDIEAVLGQAHLALAIDEAGMVKILPEALKAFMPMLMGQPGPHRCILLSNRAKGEGHPFFKEFDKAEAKGAASAINIYGCTRYSAQEIEWFKEDAGGELSPAWLEEYMLSRHSQDDDKIVPEFAPRAHRAWVSEIIKAKRSIEDAEPKKIVVVRPPRPGERFNMPIVREVDPPEYYDRYACADMGHVDFTVGLFGYYHFPLGILVITHEHAFRLATLDVIAPELDALERAIWRGREPYTRLVDGDPLVHRTMANLGWDASPANRRDPISQTNTLRVGMATGKIAIHPRCVTLIEQLTVCEKNELGKYIRTDEHGHADAIASLVYLYNNVEWERNPWPAIHPSELTGKYAISPKLQMQIAPEHGLEALAREMTGEGNTEHGQA